ncbi:glycine oxidase ThiO [Roseimaritima sediminicola]|uniref:glycine oxidase ThiO n=1 Tax=Roseimaritima sediminicola TaxID=2662066 RepID=UPI0012983C12|nr:glycine oxidase ThiO [Roseimaritima sediminicola]
MTNPEPPPHAQLEHLLCLFAKHWTPGTVKTRLAAAVGDETAAQIYRTFVQHLTGELRPALREGNFLTPILATAPDAAVATVAAAFPDWHVVGQGDGDLGQRLKRVAEPALQPGRTVILIGADCPDLPPETIHQACRALEHHDAVLGPADDGGYYLLGLRGPWQPWMDGLFTDMPWSTQRVAEITRQRITGAGRSCDLLPPRHDVDTLADLRRLLARLRTAQPDPGDQPHAAALARLQKALHDQAPDIKGSGLFSTETQKKSPDTLMSEVVVVGGGVIGLSVAWEAASRGLSVTLLERGRIGGGTSWTAAGILPPANPDTALDPLDRLRGISHRLHPQWADRLRQITGIDNGLRRCGGVYLATSPGEAAALLGQQQYWQSYQIDAVRWSKEGLLQAEPRLAGGRAATQLRTAFLLEDEYQLRSPDHLRALHRACELAGVRVLPHTPVQRFAEQGGAVEVETDRGRVRGQHVVLAGGAWSSAVARASELAFDIVPVRGQVLLYRLPAPPLTHVINEGNRYFVPREDGHLLVGSCEEEVGFNTETTRAALGELRRWAEGLLPELEAQEPVRSWAGLRPSTIDGFPYIGRVPRSQRLFVATGHYRSGMHLSCGTAVAIVDLITGAAPPLDLDAFRIGRG